MTQEEKHKRDKRFVLERIKEGERYSSKLKSQDRIYFGFHKEISKGVYYPIDVTAYSGEDAISSATQVNMIRELVQDGAIRILDEVPGQRYGEYFLFILEIIRPKFDDLYEIYVEKAEEDKKEDEKK